MVGLCVLLAVHLTDMLSCSKPWFVLFVKEFSAKFLLGKYHHGKKKPFMAMFSFSENSEDAESWVQEENSDKKWCQKVYFPCV